jgi:hypothetical protein
MSDIPLTTPSTLSIPTIEQLQQQIAHMMQLLKTLQFPQSPKSPSSIQSSSFSGIKVAPPDAFGGTTSKAETFLSQSALYFHGKRLHNDSDRIIFALSYMRGGAASQWAKLKVLEYGRQGEVTTTWD